MAIQIHFDERSDPAVIECSGELGFEDAIRSAEKLWENPDWSGRRAIWDFSAAELDFSSMDVKRLADFIRNHQRDTPPERMALVAPRDSNFGMARMFEVFREDPHTTVRVFRDHDEAVSWMESTEPETR